MDNMMLNKGGVDGKPTGTGNERLQMILSFQVWWTRTHPQSPCAEEPNWGSAAQNHSSEFLPQEFLLPKSSPGSSALPECRACCAGTYCGIGNILMRGRHLAHPCSPQLPIPAQESPQIPLHLAFWKPLFLQFKGGGCKLSSHLVLQEMQTLLDIMPGGREC